MTLYGIDISSYQHGLNLASVKSQGYSFVTARCQIPTPTNHGFIDPDYATFRNQAKANNILFAAYMFPKTYAGIQEQCDAMRAGIGDLTIPVMIDWESDSGSEPNQAFAEAIYDELTIRELLHVADVYTYGGYWSGHGGLPFSDRPWKLVAASYGSNPRGYGSTVYGIDGGDSNPGWNGFGGLPAAILQFGSNIVLDGYSSVVDGDAFRGTIAQLKTTGLFKDWTVTPPVASLPTPTGLVVAQANIGPPTWPSQSVLKWNPVSGAEWYFILGSRAPIFTQFAEMSVPPGTYHIRAYASGGKFSEGSTSITV